ncbi:MAG: helix-turn-helix domain-containing protein [Candidatus Binataceae bacterium]|nr:helix-turn-helix domain-containing protein [Candidatus Binataceae bacterium]
MRKPTGNSGLPRGPRGSGVAGLFSVPRLEELVADPGQVRVLDMDTARVLKTQAIAALNLLHGYDLERARMVVEGHGLQRRDRLVNVEEASEKLGVKPDWLYRHHKNLPFTVRHGRLLRFSELGIDDYIRRRLG